MNCPLYEQKELGKHTAAGRATRGGLQNSVEGAKKLGWRYRCWRSIPTLLQRPGVKIRFPRGLGFGPTFPAG